MDFPRLLPKSLRDAIRYSLQYSYPLSKRELWFWQIGTQITRRVVNSHSPNYSSELVLLRRQRRLYSQSKWAIAKKVGDWLSLLPTIQAVFVTGSLAMDNCPEDDDIDFFLVTTPHTLWLTRLLVVSFLTFKNLRRPPYLSEHSSARVSDRICDNLYLDSDHLVISPQNLYLAHEILQAKPLFDKTGIQYRLLSQNSWVAGYLPIAYHQILKRLKPVNNNNDSKMLNVIFSIINLFFFVFQYLYMLPFKNTEKITIHSAFFHPRNRTPETF